MMLLQCEHVTRKYQKSTGSFTAVRQVDFCVHNGDFISIIGKSGSGKSTLLNMTAGLLRPTSGKILFEGNDLANMDARAMAHLRNSRLGYIPQGLSLLANLNALDNIRLPHFLQKHEGNGVSRAQELLEKVGLCGKENSYPAELSGGEVKRVAIARALMNEPLLLLADEPTGDIDAETTQSIMELFSAICKDGTAILMATHDLDNVGYGNRLFQMSSGSLTEEKLSEKGRL